MKFHAVDTETTGLPDDPNARVIEIAISTWDSDKGIEVSSFRSFVQPSVITRKGVETMWNISKIPYNFVESAPSPEQLWPMMQSYLEHLRYPVIAWNMPFDRFMVRRSFMGIDEVTLPGGKNNGLYEQMDLDEDPFYWWDCACRAYARHRKSDTLFGLDHAFRVVCAEEDVQHDLPRHRAHSDAWRVGFIVSHMLDAVGKK